MRRVEECITEVVQVSALSDVVTNALNTIWDDDADNAARLQSLMAETEQLMGFLVLVGVEAVLKVL